jgi:hypothetical protein
VEDDDERGRRGLSALVSDVTRNKPVLNDVVGEAESFVASWDRAALAQPHSRTHQSTCNKKPGLKSPLQSIERVAY